jgi:hypothetical protein
MVSAACPRAAEHRLHGHGAAGGQDCGQQRRHVSCAAAEQAGRGEGTAATERTAGHRSRPAGDRRGAAGDRRAAGAAPARGRGRAAAATTADAEQPG